MSITVTSTPNTKVAETAAPQEKEVKAAPEVVEAKATDESLEADASETTEDESSNEETEAKEESETATAEGETSEEKPKRKSGFQKRVDKLNKKLSFAEQQAEYWRQQAMSKGPAKTEPETTTAKNSVDPSKPKPDQFETHDLYVEALTDWKLEQKLSAKEQELKEKQVKTEVQTKIEQHTDRVNKFKKAHEDFDDVLDNVSEIPLSMTVRESIVDSENGPDLMYELAKNPKELDRICKLGPIAAAREIGKIEARLSKPSETSLKKLTSNAPAPVSTVRARGTAVAKSIYDKGLSQSDYEKLRREQRKSSW